MKKILLYTFLAIALLVIAGFVYAYKKLKQDIHIPPLTEVKTIEDIVKPYILHFVLLKTNFMNLKLA